MMETSTHPLVSILVPVYGVERYMERCARSLFEQTYDNIEYVFVDDCSPDRSVEILQATSAHYAMRRERVNIVRNVSNLGLAEVRNVGVGHCHGEFLMHVDSDDWIDGDVVERCVEAQRRTGADLVVFDRKVYRKEGVSTVRAKEARSTEQLACQILAREREVSIWGMMIRTSIYKDNAIACKRGVNMSEDYQTTPRLAYHAKGLAVVHDTYYNYEMRNAGSISSRYREDNVRQELVTLDVLTRFFQDKPVAYRDALNRGKALQLCYHRHNAAYYGAHGLCEEVERLLAALPQSSLRQLPRPYRIGLRIKPHALLAKYVALLKLLKRIKNRKS